jgi:hypothetical protein
MMKLMTWAFALTLLAGSAVFAAGCCDDPACCAAGCDQCAKK